MAVDNSKAAQRGKDALEIGVRPTGRACIALGARQAAYNTAELNNLFAAISEIAQQMTPCSCHPLSSTAPAILQALAEKGLQLSGESLEALDALSNSAA